MCKLVSPRVGVAIAAALGLSACVTLPPNHVKNPQDPWESWNRGVYRVNNKLDRAVALPVAKAYVRHVPGGIRKSVSNFFANVTTPGVMVSDALEGKLAVDIGLKEAGGALQLFDTGDAVFDADPTVEADALQNGEDRVEVDDAGADLAVDELGVVGDAFRPDLHTRL